jgi:probable phosphoglycerate mutase
MIKLYFIRHGRQNSGLCNVNVPLDDAGIRQAELVAKRLKLYNIEKLYCSHLIRARETAEIIGKDLELVPIVEEDFREISFGDMEGLDGAQIKEKFGDFLVERSKAKEDIPNPGGESGEDVFNRAMPLIRRIIEEAKLDNQKNIAIVSHGGLIRSVVAGVLEAPFAKKLCIGKDLENCSITQIDFDEETGNFIVERVNDYAHIEVEPVLLRKHFKKSL